MTVEMKQKGARVASQGTTFAQKQKDSGDKKSVHINKSARRIKYLTNKEECQNYGKTGNPAICCLHKKIVSLIEEDSADEIPGVDSLDVTVVNQPTGVITGPQADPPQDAGHVRCSRNSNAVIDIALDEDPEQQVVA
jgi:hypothetical protein